MIGQTEVMQTLAKHRTDEIVVLTMSAMHEWPSYSNNPALDYTLHGAMGMAPSIGLGLALAQPDRKVWILNGDGSQLMNMGSIASIAHNRVRNVVLFVFENDKYEITGGQPIPLVGRVDFATAAKGLGFANAHSFDELPEFEAALPDVLRQEGPTFIRLHVLTGDSLRKGWKRPNSAAEVTKIRLALASEG